jgi:hypothetical protein
MTAIKYLSTGQRLLKQCSGLRFKVLTVESIITQKTTLNISVPVYLKKKVLSFFACINTTI